MLKASNGEKISRGENALTLLSLQVQMLRKFLYMNSSETFN